MLSSRLKSYLLSSKLTVTVGLLVTLILVAGRQVRADDTVRVYPAPSGEPTSSMFHVTINGQPSPVYGAKVGYPVPPAMVNEKIGSGHFTYFDVNGMVQAVVTYSRPVKQVKILPSSRAINYAVNGNQIVFNFSRTGALTVEVNGDWLNSLHMFASSFEVNPPSPGDPNVLYYGPGIHYLNAVTVHSGQTVYVAGGAILYANSSVTGPLFSLWGSNITFRGRGIIDGSRMAWHAGSLIYVWNGSNIKVNGVTLRDASGWTFDIVGSNTVTVNNIKVLGWRLNADGLDIDSSQNVNVSGSFFRTYDDLIVVKTDNTVGTVAQNINVNTCVLWNQVAHALSVGAEAQALVQNVVFTDSDVIHDTGRLGLLGVLQGDAGWIVNVQFSNIRVEQVQRLISVIIDEDDYSTGNERGHVADTSFVNISAPAPERSGPNVLLQGYDGNHMVTGTSFQNVKIAGTPLTLSAVRSNRFVQSTDVAQ